MPEEIKFLDDNNKQNNNEISEIKAIEEPKEEIPKNNNKKIILPDWNIEPPVEIQRSTE